MHIRQLINHLLELEHNHPNIDVNFIDGEGSACDIAVPSIAFYSAKSDQFVYAESAKELAESGFDISEYDLDQPIVGI